MSEEKTPEARTISLEDYEKLQEKYRRAESEREDFKRKAEAYGMTPEEVRNLKHSHDEFKKADALGDPKKFDAEVERREAEIRKQVQKDLDTLKSEKDRAFSRIKELEVTDRVFGVAASKFNDDTHDDVKAYIRKYGDLDESGNIIFKDENGKPRYAPGSTTKLMAPEDFVGWLVSTKPSWAKPTIKAGDKQEGAKTNGTNGKATFTPDMFRGMDGAQVNKALEEGGEAAARAFLSTVKL